jgi:hypothetical protein
MNISNTKSVKSNNLIKNKITARTSVDRGVSLNEDLDFAIFAKCVAIHNQKAKSSDNNLKPFIVYK